MRLYRFKEPYFSVDVEIIKTKIAPIEIYGKEKSVCDAVCLNHLIGKDIGVEGLDTYMRGTKKDINKLIKPLRSAK